MIKVTHPDASFRELEPTQVIGLPTAATGNSLAAASPLGTSTDERQFDTEYRTDEFGNVIYSKDHGNNVTTLETNAYGQFIRTTLPDPDDAGSPLSPVSMFGYDDRGNPVLTIEPSGATTTATFSTDFNQTLSQTDALNYTHAWAYDSVGNNTSYTDPDGNVWTYQHDAAGRLTSETTPDPDGSGPLTASTTTFAYDALGRPTTTTHPDATTTIAAYNAADQVVSFTDELGHSTTMTYDGLGRLTSETDREIATTSYTYDAIGQVTETVDALGGVTNFEYNTRGWRTKTIGVDPDGTGPLDRGESQLTYDEPGFYRYQRPIKAKGLQAADLRQFACRREAAFAIERGCE